ncbi:MAG TPA: riboflavin synthase [Candidatus Acidoferrales bacterium]|nr:riboflavin synthase [Candidatus Acidoferrales bacterium]
MFTGIIEAAGKIESLERGEAGGKVRIRLTDASKIVSTMKIGDSIAVSGCCLTIVELEKKGFSADLSGETVRRTSFGEKKPGDFVNLERPVAAGERLGGHFVQGHVDGIGRVTRLAQEGNNWWLSVRVPEDLRRYVAEKGSIAIDGISLTVAAWHDGIADIAVIPFTHRETSVKCMVPGDAVNLETDILAKYVESLLESHATPTSSRLTVSRLVEEGF